MQGVWSSAGICQIYFEGGGDRVRDRERKRGGGRRREGGEGKTDLFQSKFYFNQGAGRVLSFYKKSFFKALEDLFPEIGLDEAKYYQTIRMFKKNKK